MPLSRWLGFGDGVVRGAEVVTQDTGGAAPGTPRAKHSRARLRPYLADSELWRAIASLIGMCRLTCISKNMSSSWRNGH